MARKDKQMRNQQKNQKGKEKTVVTVDVVVGSKTEAEFEKNREAYINNFMDEINLLKEKKTSAEQAAESAQRRKEGLEGQNKDLTEEREKLRKERDAIKVEYDKAVSMIESAQADAANIISEANTAKATVIEEAEQKANEIREQAERERMETLTKAAEEAREAWRSQIDDLKKQIDDIACREKELHALRLKLENDRRDFDFDKEALGEERAYVSRLKERYGASSPEKVKELEVELNDEKNKYDMLIGKYKILSKRLEETQVVLDTMKTEIESSNGGRKIVSMREIVTELQELRDKYERIVAVYEEYPDDAAIAELKVLAQEAERLKSENEALEQERNGYQQEVFAARRACRDLEVIRQEVAATDALNEHLLQELASHKTALENRTGDTCPSLTKVDAETEGEVFKQEITKRVFRPALGSLKDIVSHVKTMQAAETKKKNCSTRTMIFVHSWRGWLSAD